MNSNDGVWMVHQRGGAKRVPLGQVAEKEQQKWFVLPRRYLNEDGAPKQMYFPQFDGANLDAKETQIIHDELVGDILQTEIL